MEGGTVRFPGNQRFPDVFIRGDHALDVPRRMAQQEFIEEGDVHHQAVRQEVLVQVHVLFRGAEGACRDEFAGFAVEPRGDVQARFVLEGAAEGFQDAARNILRPFFLEQLIQQADGEGDGNGLPRLAREQPGKVVETGHFGNQHVFAESLEAVRPVQEFQVVHIIAAEQVVHGYFANFHAAIRLRLIDVGEEGFFHLGHDFQMQIADGVETAPHQHDGALVQHIRRLGHLAVCQEQGGRRQAGLDKLEREQAVCSLGEASVEEIDRFNILRATHLAMARAVEGLALRADFCLVDGLPVKGLPVPHRAIVKGDGRSLSIAAASVLAKVTRDRMMTEADASYPQYGFAKHKGYGTKAHMEALRRLGPCPLHRRSFAPVSQMELSFPEQG